MGNGVELGGGDPLERARARARSQLLGLYARAVPSRLVLVLLVLARTLAAEIRGTRSCLGSVVSHTSHD